MTSSFLGPSAELPAKATTPFVVSDRWGYTPAGPDGHPELYDMVDDPLATVNVIADYPNETREMFEQYLAYLDQYGADESLMQMWRQRLLATAP